MKSAKTPTLKRAAKAAGKVAAKSVATVPAKKNAPLKASARKTAGKSALAKKAAAKSAVHTLKLVNQFPPIEVKPAPSRPRHLSQAQVSAMLKIMKIA
jgi:hypothetical protein